MHHDLGWSSLPMSYVVCSRLNKTLIFEADGKGARKTASRKRHRAQNKPGPKKYIYMTKLSDQKMPNQFVLEPA